MVRIHRLASGLYELHYRGREFQVEDIKQASDGEAQPGWMLYEMTPLGDRKFWNDFITKRAACHAAVSAVDAGH